MQKIFCQSDFSNFEEFRVGFSNLTFEPNKIICGVRSGDQDEITVEMSSVVLGGYEFAIKENDVVIDSFVLTASL